MDHNDLETIRVTRNDSNAFAKMLGITIIDLKLGEATVMMNVSDQYTNPVGSVHGGCLYTLADVAAGAAAASHGLRVTTLNSSFSYLRAGLNTRQLKAVAREVKFGKRAMVYRVSVTDQDGTELCDSTFTLMNIGH